MIYVAVAVAVGADCISNILNVAPLLPSSCPVVHQLHFGVNDGIDDFLYDDGEWLVLG